MKGFFKFFKKTWWLLIILFSAPIIVISFLAILEFIYNRIDLKASDWASLFASVFGYWGTVVLGTLAFWQNDKIQENNDLLIQYEKNKLTPVFNFTIENYTGFLENIIGTIYNCSDSVACNFNLSKVNIKKFTSDNSEISSNEYEITPLEATPYLNGYGKTTVCLNTPQIKIQNGEFLILRFEINCASIIGIPNKTVVSVKITHTFSFEYTYITDDSVN